MGRLFEESFKKMAVELSYVKESVLSAAKELDISADLLSKWRRDPRFNGGTLVPKNNKLSPEEQELRELRKRLKEAELENAILKKAVAIFAGKD
ncbi:transposase [Rhizosphaericola mali]|uniref:Transposase n=1 Tax=Rhizosphaericola mali TaxID=2545455 RepID=A0A5P2G1I5_9BACT|nr:transposase [Rhizosphaericola mali]QES88558.1 transposase [Rhizosphaericola mali]